MKSVIHLFIATLILTLSAGSLLAGNPKHHQDEGLADIDGAAEPLLGLTYAPEGIEFQVASTGCTEKAHFAMLRLSPEDQTTSQLLLVRVVPDYCDAYVPFGVRLFYSYEELKLEEGDPFTILNSLTNYRVRNTF